MAEILLDRVGFEQSFNTRDRQRPNRRGQWHW
jgi:hypothetical protein